MRRYTGLSLKYLRRRPRRTLYTFLGIALSVAFIAAIMLVFDSIELSQLRSIQATAGAFHVRVESVDNTEVLSLQSHLLVDKIAVQSILDSVAFDQGKSSILVEEADQSSLLMRGKRILEGRLPSEPGEIALDLFALHLMKVEQETGQIVTLRILGVERSFSVVGIISSVIQEKSMGKASALISTEEASIIAKGSQSTTNAYLTVKAATTGLRYTAQKVITDLDLSKKTHYNGSLIYHLENQSPLNLPAIILGLLVAVASAVSIYNTTNISVLERIREFGLISAAGATPSQIRNVVFRESLIVSLFSIPAGLFIGILLSFGISIYAGAEISGLHGMTSTISPLSMIIASLMGFLSVVVSSLIPAFKASRVTPVEAMRQYGLEFSDRRFKGISARQSSGQGIPLKLAKRNMRRNMKSTAISIISMTIAATLFIVFSYFAGNFDVEILTRGIVKSDISLRITSIYDDGPDETTIDEMLSLEGVRTVAAAKMITGRLLTEEDFDAPASKSFVVSPSPQSLARNMPVDQTGHYLTLLAYNDYGIELMRSRVLSGSIDTALSSSTPSIILDVEYSRKHSIEAGDRVQILTYFLTNEMIRVPVSVDFVVAAVVEELPTVAYTVSDGLIAACSESFLETFKPEGKDIRFTFMDHADHYSYIDIYFERESDPDFLTAAIEVIASRYRNPTMISYLEYKEEIQSSIKTLSSLVYGLIAIVGFIGLCGITNTVNTSLILRQREFGVLRAIGLSTGQLKLMLVYEGLLFGLISAIFSTLLGLLLSFALYSLVKDQIAHLTWSIPFIGIAITVFGLIVTGILTTLLSSGRIVRLRITEALRSSE